MKNKSMGIMMQHGLCLNTGLLILRIGFWAFLVFAGRGKLMGGVDARASIANMVGFSRMPAFRGFMAAISEFLGGILMIIGLFTQIAAAFAFITMAVAIYAVSKDGFSLMNAMTPIAYAVAMLTLIFTGAGKRSLDSKLCKKLNRCCGGACEMDK